MLSFFLLYLLAFFSTSQVVATNNAKPRFLELPASSNNFRKLYDILKAQDQGIDIERNYNGDRKASKVSANTNMIGENKNDIVDYNSGEIDLGNNFKINLPMTVHGIPYYFHPIAAVGRDYLLQQLRFLHKTFGSRYPQMLKVNISEEVPLDKYSSVNLVEDLRAVEKSLAKAFPRICKFIQSLKRTLVCRTPTDLPTASVGPSYKPATLSLKDLTYLKAFASLVVDAELKLSQRKKTLRRK